MRRPGYTRSYPEGEAAAHVVGFTDVRERGQEGVELAFEKDLEGRDGQRGIVRDGVGRVIDDYVEAIDPEHGREIQLSIDTKVQFFAYQRVRDAVLEHKAKAGSAVVIDVSTGEVLALANYPSLPAGAARQPEQGAARRGRAQPCTDRRVRARLGDQAVRRRLGAREPSACSRAP